MPRKQWMLFAAVALAESVAVAQTTTAQTPALAFEVASIKPAGPINPARIAAGAMRIGMTIDAARVDIGFFSIADLIRTAYRVKTYQVSGPDRKSTRLNSSH